MNSSSETKEQTVASEKYQPSLNDYYDERFKNLVVRMSHTLSINRATLIKNELEQIDIDNSDDKLEALKYASSLSVLIDLSLQGWVFDIEGSTLTLKMENDNLDDIPADNINIEMKVKNINHANDALFLLCTQVTDKLFSDF